MLRPGCIREYVLNVEVKRFSRLHGILLSPKCGESALIFNSFKGLWEFSVLEAVRKMMGSGFEVLNPLKPAFS